MKKESRHNYKWLTLIAMIYLIGWTCTYPMIYKMVEIFHVLEPGAIFLFPLSYAVGDVLAEVYGYSVARQVIWFSLITGFISCLALNIVALMPAPPTWQKQINYYVVFSPILRAYLATTIASLAGSFLNIFAISKFKILMSGKNFWFRSLLSTAIGELVFSILGGFLAYVGVESWSRIPFLMLDGYIFKMAYAFLAVWPIVIITSWLKKSEQLDTYDYSINYNPFKLQNT